MLSDKKQNILYANVCVEVWNLGDLVIYFEL